MKRIALAFVVVALIASATVAQQATITTSVIPAETKIVVAKIDVSRDCICAAIDVAFQDVNSLDQRHVVFSVPADPSNPGTELQALLGAMINPRTGETGASSRRMNFRVLGYLVDAGRLTGVTLVP